MPIDLAELRTNYRRFDSQTSVGEVLDQFLPTDSIWIVIRYPGGQYSAAYLGDLVQEHDRLVRVSEKVAFRHLTLAEALAQVAVEPLQMDANERYQASAACRAILPAIPERLISKGVVILAGAEIAGIYGQAVERAPSVERGLDLDVPGLVKGIEPVLEQETNQAKKIDVQVKDAEGGPVSPHLKPLQLKQRYSLLLQVQDSEPETYPFAQPVLNYRWPADEPEIELQVELFSDDFSVESPEPQTLTVSRSGSSSRVEFKVVPQREGPAVIKAVFTKGGAFLQVLTLRFTVISETLFSVTSSGRSLDAIASLAPRSLYLTILKASDGFDFIFSGAVAARVRLPITSELLASKISQLRLALKRVVDMPPYLVNFKIPEKAHQAALPIFARAGYTLFRELFFAANSDPAVQNLGHKLLELARGDKPLKIQVFSQEFVFPWGLLYLAREEEFDLANVQPEWFLGLRHTVEHIPLQQILQVIDSQIDSRAGLTISLNVNAEIDAKMRMPLVAPQLEFWKGVELKGRVHVVQRAKSEELLRALHTPATTPDQILYFYCHASSAGLAQGGSAASNLIFGKGDQITLEDLKLLAPMTRLLPGEPLVFINACESAELSPLFYDGFVPYFLAKGARGVVGTECEIPAVFAAEWARRFFTRFLAGEKLGQIVLDLRRDFFYNDRNLLGLIYALYVDSDTQIVPGLDV